MLAFIFRRLVLLIPTFIGITVAAFVFIRLLPGDPVLMMAGERGTTPEHYAELMHQLGYDRPIYIQYFDFLTSAVSGDLGHYRSWQWSSCHQKRVSSLVAPPQLSCLQSAQRRTEVHRRPGSGKSPEVI